MSRPMEKEPSGRASFMGEVSGVHSGVAGDVDGLGKLERPIIGVGELDEHLKRDAVFGPVDTHVWGHGCASTS